METQTNQVVANQPKASNTGRLVLTILGIVSLPVWMLMVFTSFFAFDAPGSENNRAIWAIVITIWVYPIPLFLGMLIAHILFRQNRRGLAYAVQAFPMVAYILGFGTFLAWGLIFSN
jgi:hypothetical protein